MRLLYGSAIFVSSMLLFLVQPMMAKAILPWFGGAAGVWTAAMLFFQVVLLAGYFYAYWTTRHLSARLQMACHLVLLAVSLAALPVAPASSAKPGPGGEPAIDILILLARSVGLPYFLLSSTSPLAQVWFAHSAKPAFPYRLFAVSNFGSLAALLAYPMAVEPFASTSLQLMAWSIGYTVTAVLIGVSAFLGAGAARQESGENPTPLSTRLLWLALAACPSILFLASTSVLSQSIAPIPFLWILPLSIYLLTLILCFERDTWYRPAILRAVLPAAWIVMGYCAAQRGQGLGLKATIVSMSIALFVCCMFCHGELARRKPPVDQLTSFYLTVAAGGALGGLFVGLAAPHIFDSYLELPAGVVFCVMLGLPLLFGVRSPGRLIRLGVIAVMGFVLAQQVDIWTSRSRVRVRNFYSALQVSDAGEGIHAARILSNGAIHHGAQFTATEKRRLPTTYFGPGSGAAIAIRFFDGRPLRVGIVGLGAGTLASYAHPGDFYRFYEINPQVLDLANSQFTFLRDCRGKVDVVLGDARMELNREPAQNFDVLVLDAFSGDSIPVHLLTREAFAVYFRQLRPNGILAFHITNRYVELGPVIQRLAQNAHRQAWLIRNASEPDEYIYESTWVLASSNPDLPRSMAGIAVPFPPARASKIWTDDYSNLWQVLR